MDVTTTAEPISCPALMACRNAARHCRLSRRCARVAALRTQPTHAAALDALPDARMVRTVPLGWFLEGAGMDSSNAAVGRPPVEADKWSLFNGRDACYRLYAQFAQETAAVLIGRLQTEPVLRPLGSGCFVLSVDAQPS